VPTYFSLSADAAGDMAATRKSFVRLLWGKRRSLARSLIPTFKASFEQYHNNRRQNLRQPTLNQGVQKYIAVL